MEESQTFKILGLKQSYKQSWFNVCRKWNDYLKVKKKFE